MSLVFYLVLSPIFFIVLWHLKRLNTGNLTWNQWFSVFFRRCFTFTLFHSFTWRRIIASHVVPGTKSMVPNWLILRHKGNPQSLVFVYFYYPKPFWTMTLSSIQVVLCSLGMVTSPATESLLSWIAIEDDEDNPFMKGVCFSSTWLWFLFQPHKQRLNGF